MQKKGINGQQAALETVANLEAWISSFKEKLNTKDDSKFAEVEREIAFFINQRDRNLNKSKIAEAVNFTRSSWQSNNKLEPLLIEFEAILRERKILPEATLKGRIEPKREDQFLRDSSTIKASMSEKRANQLEIENMELKARIKELESGMENLKELAEVLAELRIIKS